MIRDLLLSIALYGGVALCLAVQTQINWWLYGKVLFWIMHRPSKGRNADRTVGSIPATGASHE